MPDKKVTGLIHTICGAARALYRLDNELKSRAYSAPSLTL